MGRKRLQVFRSSSHWTPVTSSPGHKHTLTGLGFMHGVKEGAAFGDTYRVAAVEEVQGTRVGPLVALGFSAFDDLYRATEFRKVRPRADEQVAGTATSIADLRPAPAKESEVA